ncbi:hypothetical protein A9Q99_10640 [Gammaproteobacteria bacterium 45_16_T64]|nr:hypothetical protein A9Q99_10640 [Gammaproteobacteria bacterium 45_16_T64]
MFSSLRGRLFSSTVVILILFLGGTGWGLIQAFTSSIEKGAQEQLQLHIYSLLSAANESGGRLFLPEALQEPRFNVLSSGLYGAVADKAGFLWRSESSTGVGLGKVTSLDPGASHFSVVSLDSDAQFYRLGFGIVWEGEGGVEHRYTFIVMEATDRYRVQQTSFENVLWKWLAGLGGILLIAQWLVMQWGLSPMGKLAHQVRLIEEGQTQQLQGRFPKEISPVVNNLNQLVSHEHRQRERYKNTLGDLAHSLKTPLAVLRGASDQGSESLSEIVETQVKRMDQIVEYQLKRAVASRAVKLGCSIPVDEVCQKLLSTLDKVYRDKGVVATIESDIETQATLQFVGDEGDLLELMGNLLDNAYKHCSRQVQVTLGMAETEQVGFIRVDDDGLGIPDDLGEQVLNRGVRADTETPGQGIGMAVVQDIVKGYRGDISIERSSQLGGASICLQLPCRLADS